MEHLKSATSLTTGFDICNGNDDGGIGEDGAFREGVDIGRITISGVS